MNFFLESQLQQQPAWRSWHCVLTAFLNTRFSFSLWFLHVWRTPYSSSLCLPSSKTQRPQTDKAHSLGPSSPPKKEPISQRAIIIITGPEPKDFLSRGTANQDFGYFTLYVGKPEAPLQHQSPHFHYISSHFFQYFPQSKLAPTIKCLLPQAARVAQCNTPGSSFRANWKCLEKIPSGGQTVKGTNRRKEE